MTSKKNAQNIYDSLKDVLDIKKKDVIAAFSEAYTFYWEKQVEIATRGEEIIEENGEKPVFVIIGRPYNIHDKGVNLGIPETIASMGYDVIPIDMLELDTKKLEDGNYFNLFWNYGQKIIAAVKRIRETKNLFPIYLSNFNCGPDSFILSYSEEEMKGKPLLILELDEHDSDGGYQTRIEAFMDVVKSYMKKGRDNKVRKEIMPDVYTADQKADLAGTIWLPPMHFTGSRVMAAAFRGHGYDARNLEFEDEETLLVGKKLLRGGECLPMTLTLGAIVKQLEKEGMKDKKHVLFMPGAEGPCRFGQYNLLERQVFHNEGYDNIDLLSPTSLNSYQGIDEELRRYLMHSMITADILLKLVTKVRPYEKVKGDANTVYEESILEMEKLLSKKGDPKKLLKTITDRFASIPRFHGNKPLVGIVGEIYVRCNSFSNGNLIDVIEENGGEAWLAPMHEWVLYTAHMQSYLTKQLGGSLFESGESLVKNLYLFKLEHDYYKAVSKLLKDRVEPEIKNVVEEGIKYLPKDFVGEAVLTVGRAIMFAKQGASMIINAAPFGCMPGTITSSIFLEVKDQYNIPILSQFYDGDLDINDKVAALLQTIGKSSGTVNGNGKELSALK